jgi:hypothetical protein
MTRIGPFSYTARVRPREDLILNDVPGLAPPPPLRTRAGRQTTLINKAMPNGGSAGGYQGLTGVADPDHGRALRRPARMFMHRQC